MINPVNTAYIAGLVDADGCFHFRWNLVARGQKATNRLSKECNTMMKLRMK